VPYCKYLFKSVRDVGIIRFPCVSRTFPLRLKRINEKIADETRTEPLLVACHLLTYVITTYLQIYIITVVVGCRTRLSVWVLSSPSIIFLHDVYFFVISINYLRRGKRPVVYVAHMTCRLLFRIKTTLTFSIGKSMAKILRSRDEDGTK